MGKAFRVHCGGVLPPNGSVVGYVKTESRGAAKNWGMTMCPTSANENVDGCEFTSHVAWRVPVLDSIEFEEIIVSREEGDEDRKGNRLLMALGLAVPGHDGELRYSTEPQSDMEWGIG